MDFYEQKYQLNLLEPIWLNCFDDSPMISGPEGSFTPQYHNACECIDYIANVQNEESQRADPSVTSRLKCLNDIVTGNNSATYKQPLQDFYNLEKLTMTQYLFFDFNALGNLREKEITISDKVKKQVLYGCASDDDIYTMREDLQYMHTRTAFDLSICKTRIKADPVVTVSKQLVENTTRKLNFIDKKRDALYQNLSTQDGADRDLKDRFARTTLLFHYTSLMANSLACDHNMPLKNRLFFLTQTRRAAYCESNNYKL